jgi:hypothetical protein
MNHGGIICSYCLCPLNCEQPGGRNARHQDGTPYRQCGPALRDAVRLAAEREAQRAGLPFMVHDREPQEAA